jgi:hypothetical protein
MLRPLMAALALVGLTSAAQAEAPLLEQYRSASAAFLGSASLPEDYSSVYRKAVLAGIDGKWLRLELLARDGRITEAAIRQDCPSFGVRIAIKDGFSFRMTRNEGKESQVDISFNALGGNVFSQSMDAAQYLQIDMDNPPKGLLESMMIDTGGLATITRPSPDILVVQLNYRQPQIYGRCPA